jgi:hypothetical protein
VRFAVATLGVLALAAAAQAGWWDDSGSARATTLVEVRQDPARWRDVVIAIDVRVAGPAEAAATFPDRFVRGDWRAVRVEAAETDGAKAPAASLHMRRGSEVERRLAGSPAGTLVHVRAAVRDAAQNAPWIEILEATRDVDPLSVEETGVLARADRFLDLGNAAAAEPIYRALLAKRSMSADVRADVLRKLGAACWAQRRVEQAAAAYASVLVLDAGDAATAKRLATARALLASTSVSAVVAVAAPSVRLLPPSGLHDVAARPAPPPRPDVVASAPSTDEASVLPPPPKPRLAGPK